MAKVIGTCGHQIKTDCKLSTVKDIRRGGKKGLKKMLLCSECWNDYDEEGLILHDQDDIDLWLDAYE